MFTAPPISLAAVPTPPPVAVAPVAAPAAISAAPISLASAAPAAAPAASAGAVAGSGSAFSASPIALNPSATTPMGGGAGAGIGMMGHLSKFLQGDYNPQNMLLDALAPQIRGGMPGWAKVLHNVGSQTKFSVSGKKGWFGINGEDLSRGMGGGAQGALMAALAAQGSPTTMQNTSGMEAAANASPLARPVQTSRYDEWNAMPVSLGAARRMSNL